MNNIDNAIEVRNVKKYFKVYYDRGITLKDKILSRGRSKYEKREVLKGISFHVKKGEAIGLIGKNGCGKSTTLKLLTKIIYPNEGTVEMNGRVSSLLELGAGFHPDMSGKENIYMNAAVFGLSRKEIDKRVNDIIKFSELEEFIDNPVRTYSSGMYMRLAFSVAINVDADILLIDEILAVGDISFQKKCFEKLKEIKRKGTTIVIVSHSLDQIEKICDRSIWIENGLIKEEGKPREIHEHYLYDMEKARLEHFQEEVYADIYNAEESVSEELLEENDEVVSVGQAETIIEDSGDEVLSQSIEEVSEEEVLVETEKTEEVEESSLNLAEELKKLRHNFLRDKNVVHKGNQKVRFTEMYLTNSIGEEKVFFETGECINVYLRYKAEKEDLKGTLCFLIYRDDGVYCYGTNSYIEKKEIMELSTSSYLKISLKKLPLLPGKYYLTIAIHDEDAVEYERIDQSVYIQMFSNKGEQGIIRIESEWCLQ